MLSCVKIRVSKQIENSCLPAIIRQSLTDRLRGGKYSNSHNMARKSSSNSGGMLFKTGIFAVLAGVAFWLFNQFGGKKPNDPIDTKPPIEIPAKTAEDETEKMSSQVSEAILPSSTTGAIIRHTWFALSYDEDHEQAEWVVYELTRDHLNENWADRPNTFRPDPDVHTESATPRDYTGRDRKSVV